MDKKKGAAKNNTIFLGLFLLVLLSFTFILFYSTSNNNNSIITGHAILSSNGTAELYIWDSYDSSSVGLNTNVVFYVNYTNNSVFVNDATCNISFEDGNWSLMINNTNNYSYIRNFSAEAFQVWSVSCNRTNISTVFAEDFLNVWNATCGDTVYNSSVLDHDLNCSGENGLSLVVDDIVLDCNGYEIFSNLTNSTYGINFSSVDNVTLKNCNIDNFQYGILFQNSNNSFTENNNVNSSFDVYLLSSYDSIFLNSDFYSSNTGILSANSINNTFINCTYNYTNVSELVDEITFKKYFKFNVTISGSPIENATVLGYDVNLNLEFNETTAVSGLTLNVAATEYFQNYTGSYYYNNYTINATAVGYNVSSSSWNVTSDYLIDVNLVVDSTPPLILTQSETVLDTSATFNLTYNEPSNFSIVYNNTLGNYSVANSTTFAINFIGMISSLIPNTTYFYNTTICDKSSNCRDYGEFNLTTEEDTTAPYFILFDSSESDDHVSIDFEASEEVNYTAIYGDAIDDLDEIESNSSFLDEHEFELPNLNNDTVYYANITICDDHNNCNITSHSFETDEIPDDSSESTTTTSSSVASAAVSTPNSTIKEDLSSAETYVDLDLSFLSGELASVAVHDDKNTDLISIDFKSKSSFAGGIQVHSLSVAPNSCDFSGFDDYIIYKNLTIEHDFSNDVVDYADMKFFVDSKWVNQNYVGRVVMYRCDDDSSVDMKSSTSQKSVYSARLNGFSSWAILGLKEEASSTTISKSSIGIFFSKYSKYFIIGGSVIVFLVAFIVVFYLLKKNGHIGSFGSKQNKIYQGPGDIKQISTRIGPNNMSASGQNKEIDLSKINNPSLRSYVKQCMDMHISKEHIKQKLKCL